MPRGWGDRRNPMAGGARAVCVWGGIGRPYSNESTVPACSLSAPKTTCWSPKSTSWRPEFVGSRPALASRTELRSGTWPVPHGATIWHGAKIHSFFTRSTLNRRTVSKIFPHACKDLFPRLHTKISYLSGPHYGRSMRRSTLPPLQL